MPKDMKIEWKFVRRLIEEKRVQIGANGFLHVVKFNEIVGRVVERKY